MCVNADGVKSFLISAASLRFPTSGMLVFIWSFVNFCVFTPDTFGLLQTDQFGFPRWAVPFCAGVNTLKRILVWSKQLDPDPLSVHFREKYGVVLKL